MLIIYGIPNCDTIKKARTWLIENKIEHRFYDYNKEGIGLVKLEDWDSQKGIENIINKAGATYKKLSDEEKSSNLVELKTLIIQKPSLIKRPILELDGNIIGLGFKPEWYQEIFK